MYSVGSAATVVRARAGAKWKHGWTWHRLSADARRHEGACCQR